MENIKVTVQGTKLTIEIDATKDLGMSKSGKTRLVASSQGNQKVNVAGNGHFTRHQRHTK